MYYVQYTHTHMTETYVRECKQCGIRYVYPMFYFGKCTGNHNNADETITMLMIPYNVSH